MNEQVLTYAVMGLFLGMAVTFAIHFIIDVYKHKDDAHEIINGIVAPSWLQKFSVSFHNWTHQKRTDFKFWFADRLPDWVVEFAIVRAWAWSSSGQWSNDETIKIKAVDVLRRWQSRTD